MRSVSNEKILRMMAVAVMCLLNGVVLAQKDENLPDQWSRNFKVIVYSNGGKQDVETKITFTDEVCQYAVKKDAQKKTSIIKMTNAERAEILTKLHELKADKIRQDKAGSRKRNTASNGYCLYAKDKFCVEESVETGINEEDKTNFHLIYQYLVSFATQKRM